MLMERERALRELGEHLRVGGYHFVTPTPATHARVNLRALAQGRQLATDLRDVFGWSRPFRRDLLPPALLSCLERAEALHWDGELGRATVRYASLGEHLFVHSSFPTLSEDAVFFGPDSYRFARFVTRSRPTARVLDVGCGSGVGGLCLPAPSHELLLCDVNERALSYARVNAALAGRSASVICSDVLGSVAGSFDLIVANPPFMRDASGRTYRDGGGEHGEALSLRIVREALPRLCPGGALLLYTGAAIVAGRDAFYTAVRPLLESSGYRFRYEELDPDVFGEELSEAGYEDVERIAAVGLTVVYSDGASVRDSALASLAQPLREERPWRP